MDLIAILKAAYEAGASDIHLVAGQPPVMRVHQVITAMDFPVITRETCRAFVETMASPEALANFDRLKDADFSYAVRGWPATA
jgi:twitching motility protein PilT